MEMSPRMQQLNSSRTTAQRLSDRVTRAEKHSGGTIVKQERVPPTGTRIFLGLGNPGDEYADTYHNAGMVGVEYLAARMGAHLPFRRPRGSSAIACAERLPYRFVRSLVFMNESGVAASESVAKFGIPPATLMVLHDDADLPIGSAVAVFGRGAAGHHGVADIIRVLNTNQFWRIRIGVRPLAETHLPHGKRKRRPAGEFILHRIPSADHAAIIAALAKIPLPFL